MDETKDAAPGRFPASVVRDAQSLGLDYGVLEATAEAQFSSLMPYQLTQVEAAYAREVTAPPLRIVDATANVGADALNLKRMYPGAEVVAVEIDGATAE